MIAMCCQLPSTTMSATITSADANPSPSATHARSSNQVGATRNHYTTETPEDAVGIRAGVTACYSLQGGVRSPSSLSLPGKGGQNIHPLSPKGDIMDDDS